MSRGGIHLCIFVPNIRLKEHIESNKQTCLATIMGFLPNLRDIVVNELNAEAITEQLRAK